MSLDPAQTATLHRLLDEALELDPERRGPWLARVRADHPAVARELEALLAAEPDLDARGFLMGQALIADLPGAGEPQAAALTGRRFGAYALERPIGRGGMGSVWLARRSDGRFEGEVAIKLLNLALLDPVGSERFRREGSTLARLTHPNIARLIDAGVSDDGQPYLVLEHVAGVRIDRYCDEHRLAPSRRILLFRQVLAAVEHAHASLVVHRDLKASNILVTPDGTVKLLDFGIAKLLEDEADTGERTELTERGGLPFTPEYAAPEQVSGGPVTTATDVYALGVLLYLLLAGRHPTAPGQSAPAQHLRAIMDAEPPRLSVAVSLAAADAPAIAGDRSATVAQLRRGYAGDLDNILAKALRKSPDERYRTAAAFDDDLRRYLRTEPVGARADSVPYRLGKFLRRNRGPVAAGTIVAVALIATTAFSVDRMREARVQRDLALYQGRRAEAQSEFQSVLMSQLGDRPMTMREIVDRGREVVERQYHDDPRLLGPMLLQLSRRYAELGDGKTRERLLVSAESLAVLGGGAGALAEVRCEVADQLRTRGEPDSARAVLRQADSIRRRSSEPAVDEACLIRHAELAIEVGDTAAAIAAIRENLSEMERRGRTGQAMYFEVRSMLAATLADGDRQREAVDVFRRTLDAVDSSGRGGTMLRSVLDHNFAFVLTLLGETAEAESRFHEVLVSAAAGDPSGYVHSQPLIHYAESALTAGHADSAAKYFTQLARQAVADSSRYWEGRAMFGLVRAQAALGRLAEARVTADRFRTLRHDFLRLTSTDDQLPDTLAVAGWLALAAGDTAAAHQWFMASLRANRYFEGTKMHQQRAVAVRAAETAIAQGRYALIDSLVERALAVSVRDPATETRSALVGEIRLIEAKAMVARGDTARARARLERASAALRTGAGPSHPRTAEADSLLARLRRSLAAR